MSDEQLSWTAKLLANIGSKNTRRGAQINACIIGVVLFALYTIQFIDPRFFTSASPLFHIFGYYAAVSLFSMAFLVASQSFITPEVRHPNCNFCGGPMSTTQLKCERCQSSSMKGD